MKTKLSALSILLLGSLAFAGQPSDTLASGKGKADGGTTPKHQETSQEAKPDSAQQSADNSGVNKRDNQPTEPTADQQKNGQSDVDLTAKVRRSIVSDKSLSTNAHNVKIIAQNGVVTLKGPVHSEAEKSTIEQRASSIAGQSNVKNEIDVKP
jgi:hyperosmotically inducible periplasmic protein